MRERFHTYPFYPLPVLLPITTDRLFFLFPTRPDKTHFLRFYAPPFSFYFLSLVRVRENKKINFIFIKFLFFHFWTKKSSWIRARFGSHLRSGPDRADPSSNHPRTPVQNRFQFTFFRCHRQEPQNPFSFRHAGNFFGPFWTKKSPFFTLFYAFLRDKIHFFLFPLRSRGKTNKIFLFAHEQFLKCVEKCSLFSIFIGNGPIFLSVLWLSGPYMSLEQKRF